MYIPPAAAVVLQDTVNPRCAAERQARLVASRGPSVPVQTMPWHKRAFDLVFSAGVLLFGASWLFPLIALLIKLDSPGPVFFGQVRIGLGGRPFVCYKFRTMVCDPEARFRQATPDDPRATRVGRFLRRTNLDEMPQFFNVLIGNMTVVGPRPHVADLDAQFMSQVDRYTLRQSVMPGVTGLAQVSGCCGETRTLRQMVRRVRYDRFYAHRRTFWLDLTIILKTIRQSIKGVV